MRCVSDNIISSITGSGKHGIYIADGVVRSAVESVGAVCRNNFYGCTSNSNISIGSRNLTLNPNYANAPVDLTPTNTSLRFLGGVGAL